MCFEAKPADGTSHRHYVAGKGYDKKRVMIPVALELPNAKTGQKFSFTLQLDDIDDDACGDEPDNRSAGEFTVRERGSQFYLVETGESLDWIGGLDVLRTWLLKRKDAFGQKAIDYGLPTPKGLLIVRIPGSGKSLTAKVFGVTLLKLDAGKIHARIVGQSESNLRLVIQTAETIAPCVLWLDEIEKGMAGSKNSGATDGGTSARVFGSFISWMQEKSAPVFVVATANDVSQ